MSRRATIIINRAGDCHGRLLLIKSLAARHITVVSDGRGRRSGEVVLEEDVVDLVHRVPPAKRGIIRDRARLFLLTLQGVDLQLQGISGIPPSLLNVTREVTHSGAQGSAPPPPPWQRGVRWNVGPPVGGSGQRWLAGPARIVSGEC